VYEVNATTVKFCIRNEAMRRRVLNRGMWNIMDIPMVLSKWTPFQEDSQPAMKSIQLWVTLTDGPPSMFTDKGLEFLASAVGKPIRLHPKTEACVSFDEAQILIEADLTKDLPREYVFTDEEEGELDAVITYSYPWLPPRFNGCGKWGHLKETCLSIEKTSTGNSDSVTIPAVASEPVQPSSPITGKAKEVVHVTLDEVPKIQSNAPGEVEVERGEDEGWITPKTTLSPGKSHVGLKFGEVSILSNSYSVLRGAEDIGEEVSKEMEPHEPEEKSKQADTHTQEVENKEKKLSGKVTGFRAATSGIFTPWIKVYT